MPDFNAGFLSLGLIWYVVFLFSTVLHEASHAFVAQMSGDDTAARGGQVGLDPLPHMQREPWGMVLIPWLTYLTQGWMMGWASAPYDPYWADRYPKKAARMALAGPAANFSLMFMAAVVIRVGLAQGWLSPPDIGQSIGLSSLVSQHGDATAISMLLSCMFSLNLLLGCFNLVPLPPLDGSAAIGLFMPEETARKWMSTIRQPNFAMMGMLLAWVGFKYMAGPIFSAGLALLYPGQF